MAETLAWMAEKLAWMVASLLQSLRDPPWLPEPRNIPAACDRTRTHRALSGNIGR